MKHFSPILVGLLFMSVARGEVWEKPEYQADENHLTEEALQEQEASEDDEKHDSALKGQRENQEEETAPRDYTTGEDTRNPPRVRR